MPAAVISGSPGAAPVLPITFSPRSDSGRTRAKAAQLMQSMAAMSAAPLLTSSIDRTCAPGGDGPAEEAPALGQRRDQRQQRVVARLRIGRVVGRRPAAEIADLRSGVVLANDELAAVADAVAAVGAVAEGADELHPAAQPVDDRIAAGLAEQQARMQPVVVEGVAGPG